MMVDQMAHQPPALPRNVYNVQSPTLDEAGFEIVCHLQCISLTSGYRAFPEQGATSDLRASSATDLGSSCIEIFAHPC